MILLQVKPRTHTILMLLKWAKPLSHIMLFTITMGVVGFLSGTLISVLGGYALIEALGFKAHSLRISLPFAIIALALILSISKYLEQLSGHYIAFKLLAKIRQDAFSALRKLAPAKLEGRDKGNLITLITTDIELIEVFYAHTIAPVAIAFFYSILMTGFIGSIHVTLGVIAFAGYTVVGIIIPMVNAQLCKATGRSYRNQFGEFNSFLLESLHGLREIIQLGQGNRRRSDIAARSGQLSQSNKSLKNREGINSAITDFAILSFGLTVLSVSVLLFKSGSIPGHYIVIATLAMFGSFGPTVALSSLSNDLAQTLASSERILALLSEVPETTDITGGVDIDPHTFKGLDCKALRFGYSNETILNNVTLHLPSKKIIGIHGASGSGKSTFLKLIMRFWDLESGDIVFKHDEQSSVKTVNTASLRALTSYVTQDTYLFHDTIEDNIRLAKPSATDEEIIEAAKKASVHSFIAALPKGYKTPVGELGSTLSGGERQRIGLARSFLHDAPIMLLDEPTSNVDSLNEGIILKAIKDACHDKCVILVSHRQSTLGITDIQFEMNRGRVS